MCSYIAHVLNLLVGLLFHFRSYLPTCEVVLHALILVFLFTCFRILSHWHLEMMLSKLMCREINSTAFYIKDVLEGFMGSFTVRGCLQSFQ